jgi:hypothetical protein
VRPLPVFSKGFGIEIPGPAQGRQLGGLQQLPAQPGEDGGAVIFGAQPGNEAVKDKVSPPALFIHPAGCFREPGCLETVGWARPKAA